MALIRCCRVPGVLMFVCMFSAIVAGPWSLLAQSGRATGVRPGASISESDLREWLGYLASDDLQGRQVFTEGYGLAAQYVATRLEQFGVAPFGANGSYLQPVRLRGYRVTRNSSVTVEAGGQSRTFKHGDHVTFGVNSGGRQTLTFSGVEFAGYGLPADLEKRDLKGKLVVTVPNLAPPPARGAGPGATGTTQPAAGTAPGVDAAQAAAVVAQLGAAVGRGGRGGSAAAMTAGAAAAIAYAPPAAAPTPAEQALVQAQTALAQATTALNQAQQAVRGGRAAAPGGARGAQQAADVTSVQRVDSVVAPQFTGDDTFFEALFADAPVKFADIKARAQKGETLQPVSLPAKVTVTIDNTYEVISQQVTHNVVGLVEGSDPRLKETYVLIGAHLDHVGYSQTGAGRSGSPDACRRRSPAAQAAVIAAGKTVQRPTPARGGAAAAPNTGRAAGAAPAGPFDQRDVISNGADDDASGSTALMAVAGAFAAGPRPKRSVVFVWHAGEESGLYGSRYNADFPPVAIERIQANFNLDMVGRDDCDNLEGDYTNTVFVVGADRISTDLHNIIVETNGRMKTPLTLDYELNDLQDPENVYTRSDHFAYESKGIPVAFFTTGLHPDYHRVSDSADKIKYAKLARVAELVHQTVLAIANNDRPLERDNKGVRTGFGSKAEVLAK
jgi:hypothetical protein